ncbi:MAG: glycine oxidase ThiO [Mariprofundales bacterium]|nr:glycine oxidase ThiO [Mariprofundales bacterium]
MRITVIGGGIIGCLTSCYLRQRGFRVTLIEAGDVGRESSWAGAGILCPIQPWLYPDIFTEFIHRSLELYPDLSSLLLKRTGVDIGWRESGMLIPFFGGEPHWQAAIDWSQRCGWQVEQQDGEAALMEEPVLARSVQRALLWPQVAQLRNPRLLKAVRIWMAQLGVELLSGCRVQQIVTERGGVAGVLLADGGRLAAERVLVAAGSWSDQLLQPFGISLSIQPVKGQIVLLKTAPGRVRRIIKHDRIYLVPRDDGRLLVGASMENVGFRAGNTVAAVHALLDGVMRLFPGLEQCEIERQWMGFRPGSPDGMPFLGAIDGVDGLFVASGHYRNGVALAPITAYSMARLIGGDDAAAAADLAPFSPLRVVDSSPVTGYTE